LQKTKLLKNAVGSCRTFCREWKDLGTWNTLTDELSEHTMGNVITDEESENTHVINELELPIMCIGARNLVIVAPQMTESKFRTRIKARIPRPTPTICNIG
jgi:mannose-1-phosphate guanylyltransferase